MKKILLLTLLQAFCYAGNDPAFRMAVSPCFQENKGQMTDQHHHPMNDLLFRVHSSRADMYITTWGLSYVFTKKDKQIIPSLENQSLLSTGGKHENENTTVQYTRADLILSGAQIRRENILKEGESEDRTDYYQAYCPNGITKVKSYQKITIRNIYPGIDWVISNESSDFIVHPGADPSQIRLQYKWTDQPQMQSDGSVKINTPMGSITEGNPLSFSHHKQQKIPTRYTINQNEISFKLSEYNKEDTLVIDPPLLWASYYGGNSQADIYSIHTDSTHVWVTGESTSSVFPLDSSQAGTGRSYFQGTFQGLTDMVILEFTTCGQLIWSTYYGGTGNELGSSIYSDGKNVWITGTTRSTDFPTSFPTLSYQQPALGASKAGNAFILQFNCNNNERIWATYYGGSKVDFGNSIRSDGQNVWVCGQTNSTDFPLHPLAGAYNQALYGGGTNDAFILQFSCTSGSLLWATYYGGDAEDQANSISSDKNNIWLTGSTSSLNFPVRHLTGAYNQPNLGGTGAINAFVLQFSISRAPVWATYYGGSSLTQPGDGGNSISSDGQNVYVTGYTTSTDFHLQNLSGAYNQKNLKGAGGNAFILKINAQNSALLWGTYYGGSSSINGDVGQSIQSDGNNIWVCGSTNSSDFPTLAPPCGYYQDTIGRGGEDVFILQFNPSGKCLWATYYGADFENDGTSISSDGTSLFVSGDASAGSSYPLQALTGAYFNDTINNSMGGVNGSPETMFIGKFGISCSPQQTFTAKPDTSICKGSSVKLTAEGASNCTWLPASGLTPTLGSVVTANPQTTTTYTVTGKSEETCLLLSTTVSVSISTTACDSVTIFIPNVFSPNGDGKNDQFYFRTTGINELNYTIYNRWGEIIFTATAPDTRWAGKTSSGTTAPDGVYYYVYQAESNTGKNYKGSGFIQLIQ